MVHGARRPDGLVLVPWRVRALRVSRRHRAAHGNPQSQADRARRRIRALQAEADRLAAQARTVFGDLRQLEIEREIKQESCARPSARWRASTADRDATAKRLTALEAIRIAGTPGVSRTARRAVEARPRRLRAAAAGRRTTSARWAAWRAAWPPSPSSIACGSRRIAAPRRRTGTRSHDLNSNAPRWRRCRRTPRARSAAVEHGGQAPRNRLIDDLDRRRDLAAQFVAELQQAQRELERTIASADAARRWSALPIRPFQGDLPWPIRRRGRPRVSAARPSGRFGTTIVRNGIEVAATEGTDGERGARGHGRVTPRRSPVSARW